MSIDRSGRYNGATHCHNHPNLNLRRATNPSRTRQAIAREILITWAGLVAEEISSGRRDLRGLGADDKLLRAYLPRLVSTVPGQLKVGTELLNQAISLISDYWGAVEQIAHELLERGRLTGQQCRRIVQTCSTTSRIRRSSGRQAVSGRN